MKYYLENFMCVDTPGEFGCIYGKVPVEIPGNKFEELGELVSGYEFIRSDLGIVYCRYTYHSKEDPRGWIYNHQRNIIPVIKRIYDTFDKECQCIINEHLQNLQNCESKQEAIDTLNKRLLDVFRHHRVDGLFVS